MGRASVGTQVPAAVSSSTSPSSTTRPRSRATRPARARSRVVLPAPLGPSSTTSSPVATTSSTSSSSRPRVRATWASRLTGTPLGVAPSPGGSCARAGEPAVPQGDQHGQRDRQQDQAEGDGRLQVGLQRDVDGQRHRLGDPGQVAGEGDGGAELPQGPRPAERHPSAEGGGDQGQGDPPQGGPAAGPQGGGGVLVAPVHGPQPGLAGDDQERHGHKRLGQDGPGGREGQ